MEVSRPRRWVGHGLAILITLLLSMSATMKLVGGPEVEEGIGHLGLPQSMMTPLAILEIVCALIFVIPVTSVTGAILLVGYLGGAICTHWRVGDPVYTQIVLGLLVWLSVYLREPRLASLLPIRRS